MMMLAAAWIRSSCLRSGSQAPDGNHVDILLYLTRIERCHRKHSHEGGGADARFGIVTDNLIVPAPEGGNGARNLFVTRLCLEHGPASIDELYEYACDPHINREGVTPKLRLSVRTARSECTFP